MEPTPSAFWLNLALDRESAQPLQRQLYEQVRAGILARTILPGSRVPSSRALAAEVGCSRNTIVEVLEQLGAEGYLTTVRGSGAYVAADLPEEPPRTTPGALEIGAYDHAPAPQLSARGRETA
ncbi:MAG: GntR family transcriptional regulator, partial [Vulcanimicrobiaceae bacterium]